MMLQRHSVYVVMFLNTAICPVFHLNLADRGYNLLIPLVKRRVWETDYMLRVCKYSMAWGLVK